LQCACR